jgi:hypothetical protein
MEQLNLCWDLLEMYEMQKKKFLEIRAENQGSQRSQLLMRRSRILDVQSFQ